MSLPKRNRKGETHQITMMELRSQPGEVLDAARDGAIIHITKNGTHIATLVGADSGLVDDIIIIRPDGTTVGGQKPLTWREPGLLRN
jgi:prevent-host-death family protein